MRKLHLALALGVACSSLVTAALAAPKDGKAEARPPADPKPQAARAAPAPAMKDEKPGDEIPASLRFYSSTAQSIWMHHSGKAMTEKKIADASWSDNGARVLTTNLSQTQNWPMPPCRRGARMHVR